MRQWSNRRPTSIFILLFLLLLTACQSVLPLPKGNDEPNYSGTLRVALFEGHIAGDTKPYLAGQHPLRQYPIQERMKAFMSEHPDVQVEIIDIKSDPKSLETILADPLLKPDIIELNVNEARLAAAGRIDSLAERFEDNAAQWDGDYMRLAERVMIDGEPYLLPVRSDPMLVYYDRAAFARLGLAEPREGWTITEYAETAAKLLAAGEPVYVPYSVDGVEPVVRGWGGMLAADDRSRVSGYLDSPATVEAYVRYVQMMPQLGSNGDPRDLEALGMTSASELRRLSLSAQADHGVGPVPATLEGGRVNTAKMTGLAIVSDSSQKELAWALMACIAGETSDEAMDFVAQNTLEVAAAAFRSEHPKFDELRDRMKRESAIAEPSAFDLFQQRQGTVDDRYPYQTPEQIAAYKEREIAERDLTLLAQQLESWMALLRETQQTE